MTPLLRLNPQTQGLSDPLAQDLQTIDYLLGQVVLEQEGPEVVQACQDLLQACLINPNPEEPRQNLFEAVPALQSPETAQKVARAYTVFFQLLNLAEQKEIIRVNRTRENRPESIRRTLLALAESGTPEAQAREIFARLHVVPTLTAHPTEARRRAVLDKLEAVARGLAELSNAREDVDLDRPLDGKDMIRADLHRALSVLWQTEELDPTGMSVNDEVDNAIYFFERTIFRVVSWIQRDFEQSWQAAYQSPSPDFSGVLRYRSWVGGDRDGNPNVTPEVTARALRKLRSLFVNNALTLTERLMREATQGPRALHPDDPVALEITRRLARAEHSSVDQKRAQGMPYAQFLASVAYRLRLCWPRNAAASPPWFSPAEYLASGLAEDLALLQNSLESANNHAFAATGLLPRLVRQVRAFAKASIALDIRQHSDEHARPVAELLAATADLDSPDEYLDLPEDDKINLLRRELQNPRPLVATDWTGSPQTESVREVFRTIRAAHAQYGKAAIQAYIVSMTHGLSDLLEVAVLAKDAGLLSHTANGVRCDLDLVPLLETIDDLESGPRLLQTLFADPLYREILASRDHRQEIMLGYSDSSKDGGYLGANWALQKAQARLAETARAHKVGLTFFHGRGGTVGRGGGRANRAILSQPADSFDGSIRFTEQGEVVSFRYTLRPIAHRHLEQILSAALLAAHPDRAQAEEDPQWAPAMQSLADLSRKAYRDLVYNDPGFLDFYTQATPIPYISKLSIASRPVMRPGRGLDSLEGLRAIPWNFAWVQTRYGVPGWYGLGTALEQFCHADPAHLPLLQSMAQNWPFFTTVLENAELELCRSHLPTADLYRQLVDPPDLGERFHQTIAQEHARATKWLVEVLQRNELMERSKTVRQTIDFRNPLLFPLNCLQVALLRQLQEPTSPDQAADDKPAIDALLQTIAGIAAGMQSTG